jgi:hypothetical protein
MKGRQLVIYASPQKSHPKNNWGVDATERFFKVCTVLFGDLVKSVSWHLRERFSRNRIEIADHGLYIYASIQSQRRASISGNTDRRKR